MNTLPKRLRDKITVNTDGCWIFTGAKRQGYGLFRYNSKTVSAHRLIYTLLGHTIEDGKVLDHYRMNPGPRNAPCSKSCCNPTHLQIVTQTTNIKRRDYWSGKDHCPHGHEYTEDNTRVYHNRRFCRECQRVRSLQWYHDNKHK